MTDTLRALLQPGYEPGDGSAKDAQQVDEEWWHPVFGCDSLQKVVDNARSMLEPSPGYIDPEHQGQDLEMLQAFYRACGAEGGTADEIHLRGIKAALATQQAALPAPKTGNLAEQDYNLVATIAQDMRARGVGSVAIVQHVTELMKRVNHRRSQATPAAPPAPDATHNPPNPAPLLWLLWNHLGSQSPVGQPIREYLGMGQFDRMTKEQVEAAKQYVECETCQGSGTIDETLGGWPTDNPAATCPDCDGVGEARQFHRLSAPLAQPVPLAPPAPQPEDSQS